MTFYERLLIYISFSTFVFNTYGMKKMKQYEKPIKHLGNKLILQKSGMPTLITPKTQQFLNANKTATLFKNNRPMSTTKEQTSVRSKSWLTKSWAWLKSKFVTPPQEKTRSSFADLFFKNAATPAITPKGVVIEQEALPVAAKSAIIQKREEIKQEFLPVIESLSKGITDFESPHIRFENDLRGIHSNRYCISYYIGNRGIGYQSYSLYSGDAHLSNIYVDKEYRKYGIGKSLIEAALAHIKSKGANRVSLTRGSGPSYSDPQKLDRLFQSLGFKPLDEDSDTYELYLQQEPEKSVNKESPSQQTSDLTSISAKSQKRAEIEQEFSLAIEALNKGDTHFKSEHIKFEEDNLKRRYDKTYFFYKISYYIDGNEIGFQSYMYNPSNEQGYLAGMEVKENYRGYGLGRLLIRAALAHLKSRGANRVWLAATGNPKIINPIFRAEGFTKNGVWELYLQKAGKIKHQFLPAIKALSEGNTEFESEYGGGDSVRLTAIEGDKEYEVDYYANNKKIGYLRYNIETGYLSNIHIEKEFPESDDLFRLLIRSALAHLKSRVVKRAWFMRDTGEHFSNPEILDTLLKAEGFKPWYKNSSVYQFYLQEPEKTETLEKKPVWYEESTEIHEFQPSSMYD